LPNPEVAELASMSMELISMDNWNVYFDNEEDLKRAKRDQLFDVLKTLPWVAVVDQFQHWIYTNPDHTDADRTEAWIEIYEPFGARLCRLERTPGSRANLWQKQLHIFEVPFYYIEYGMAQLGAIAVWKNYKENPEKGLQQYLDALKLGYTKTITEIYETAGIKFDFSAAYVKELAEFVKAEMDKRSAPAEWQLFHGLWPKHTGQRPGNNGHSAGAERRHKYYYNLPNIFLYNSQ
jgi:oligoendopeptidase F